MDSDPARGEPTVTDMPGPVRLTGTVIAAFRDTGTGKLHHRAGITRDGRATMARPGPPGRVTPEGDSARDSEGDSTG